MSLVTKDLDAGLLKTLAYFHHQSSSTNDLGCTQEHACVESWVLWGLKTTGMVCTLPNSLKGMKADPRYLDGTVAGCETWVYYHQSRPKSHIYPKSGIFQKLQENDTLKLLLFSKPGEFTGILLGGRHQQYHLPQRVCFLRWTVSTKREQQSVGCVKSKPFMAMHLPTSPDGARILTGTAPLEYDIDCTSEHSNAPLSSRFLKPMNNWPQTWLFWQYMILSPSRSGLEPSPTWSSPEASTTVNPPPPTAHLSNIHPQLTSQKLSYHWSCAALTPQKLTGTFSVLVS